MATEHEQERHRSTHEGEVARIQREHVVDRGDGKGYVPGFRFCAICGRPLRQLLVGEEHIGRPGRWVCTWDPAHVQPGDEE